MRRITVDLDDELHERLHTAAYDRHESMSVIVRRVLDAALPRRDRPPQEAGHHDEKADTGG